MFVNHHWLCLLGHNGGALKAYDFLNCERRIEQKIATRLPRRRGKPRNLFFGSRAIGPIFIYNFIILKNVAGDENYYLGFRPIANGAAIFD